MIALKTPEVEPEPAEEAPIAKLDPEVDIPF